MNRSFPTPHGGVGRVDPGDAKGGAGASGGLERGRRWPPVRPGTPDNGAETAFLAQLDKLKGEEKEALEKVLTPEQLKRLRELRTGEKEPMKPADKRKDKR